ncbi:MAG: DNA/RNA nuclease SfsA, partial [Candidatus Hodarchaeota archaeon]
MSKDDSISVGTFIERPNRFLAIVELETKIVEAFVPNPGRMYELLLPGKRIYVRSNPGDHRKTDYDLIAVEHDSHLVSIDANLPNRFMKRELENHTLEWFTEYDSIISEPRMYNGRFDFQLEGEKDTTLIEVKSCTLVEKGRAIFPDAPTVRGARHMQHLASALGDAKADRAVVVFV